MTPLQKKTYELLKKVPAGRVTTYKALAHALGTRSYRAIGQFMKHNPYAPDVPCHRVVAAGGAIGGFMGKTDGKEITRKIRLLQSEGVRIRNRRTVDFSGIVFTFR